MVEISIIVPVFNVEKYINKCIDSILMQTFSNFELILVDDGSTDNSGKICDEYLGKDNRIKVIHQKNSGLSCARNVGIENSTGNFLGFVDSDDYLESDMYQILYDDIKHFDADISVCQFYDEYDGKRYFNNRKSKIKRCVFDNISAFKFTVEGNFLTVNAVNKLYSRRLFDNVRYPVGKTYEDAFVTPILMFNSKRISYNPSPKYVYVHRKNSITSSEYNPSDFCIIEAYENIFLFAKKNIPSLSYTAYQKCLYSYSSFLDKVILIKNFKNKNLINKIIKILKRNSLNILTSNCFSWKKKLKIIFIKINLKLYKFILKLVYKR